MKNYIEIGIILQFLKNEMLENNETDINKFKIDCNKLLKFVKSEHNHIKIKL